MKGDSKLTLQAQCISLLCMYGWRRHRVSTNKTVNCIIEVLDHIEECAKNEALKATYKPLVDIIKEIFATQHMPFRPNGEYGDLFIRFPDSSKEMSSYESDEKEMENRKRERALFFMVFYEVHNDSMRLRYMRECERIRSCVFFRYSQYRAQVMFNSASDEQRTRLSHSLEVEV